MYEIYEEICGSRLTIRNEPAAVVLGGTAASVRAAVGYLEVHARWAATSHPDFDGYLDDLRLVHGRLERATGRDDRPEKAEARCFECSGTLLRLRKDGQPCDHTTPPTWPEQFRYDPERERDVLFRSADDVRVQHARQVKAWEREHRDCVQGGFADEWVCSRCGVKYEYGRYLRAVADKLRVTVTGWSLPAHVAVALDVPLATVRSWAARGLVATACLVGEKPDKRLRVNYEEVAERVRRMLEERRRREERAHSRAS